MIPQAEVRALAAEWQLRMDVIEKDYMLGWLLAGIAQEPELRDTWVFKGGTCLRKCYYETYRFSEDLDFTVGPGGPQEPADLSRVFVGVADWLFEASGIQLRVGDDSFVRRKNRRGNPTTQGRLAFSGPNQPPQLPKVKLDLTSDEVLVSGSVGRPIAHPYSDGVLPVSSVPCYSLPELFAEKLRALAERCRPRDLYDVIHIYRHPDLLGEAPAVTAILDQKCAHAGIAVPTAESVRAEPHQSELEEEWANMLDHQLPHLPPVREFWAALDDVFAWLGGQIRPAPLPRAELGPTSDWMPEPGMTTWRLGVPLELIRFAGANRLKVEIDYRAENGRVGPRVVDPYSLRRTRDGNLILFVVNDRGQLRSYRLDRIAAARPTNMTFTPRFRVEF
ncbi:MAG: nucleotidyl transferase AbiEii/AbiGii toxin family protein [Actinomycetota bacterium]